MKRSYATEPYLEGTCTYLEDSGIYVFNGDYAYGVGGTCLEAKVDFSKNWYYKHNIFNVVAERHRPLYPVPAIMPPNIQRAVPTDNTKRDEQLNPIWLLIVVAGTFSALILSKDIYKYI